MKFETWMNKVDNILTRMIGLDSNDLPDQCYRDMFDDNMSPVQAVRQVQENEGF
jgi:hypothetical protein